MAVKFTNNAATTLAAGINSSATSISVTDGSVFPSLSSGEHFYCTFDDTTNVEIVKVTARSSNTLTVVRGQDNTTARAFSSGDKAELRVVAALLEDVKTEVTSTLSVDTFTGDDSTTAFTLSQAPSSEDNLIVFIEGVYQNPGDFTLSGTTLTLDSAPVASRKIVAYHVSGAVSGNNLNHDQFTANGSTAAFTLSISPIHENNTQVFIDGVYQQKDSYSVSGTTLTLDANPANGAKVEVMTFTQTDVNTIPASFVSGLTEVTAVGADHMMIFDATDSALKKALVSDVIEGTTTTINNNADNRIITGSGTANTLNGESTLTFDSNNCLKIIAAGNTTNGGNIQLGITTDDAAKYTAITANQHDSGTETEGFLLIGGNSAANDSNLVNIGGGFGEANPATAVRFFTGSAATREGTLRATIDANGKFMLGTSSPDSLFHIESATTTAMTIQAGTNSSASLRLKNDAVDWDINCQTNDNFAIYSQTASAERLVINGSGHVTFTGSSPVSSPYEGAIIENLSNGARLNIGRSANAIVVGLYNTNGHVGSITTSGSTTSYSGASDYRLKENLDYTWDATTRLKQLRPVRFNWISDSTDTLIDGFLAHEVSEIVPEAIYGEKDAVDDEGNPEYQMLDQSKLVPLLVKTIQELEARIETLENA